MKNYKNYLFVLGFVVLAGCEPEPSEDLQDSLSGNSVSQSSIAEVLAINAEPQAVGTATTFSDYDPTSSLVPSAIDIFLSGSLDGTLNIPITTDDDGNIIDPQAPLKTALNVLDGFSTVTPITTKFVDASGDPAAIDATSVTPAAVRMFEVGLSQLGGAVVAIKNELSFGVDFVATLSSIDPTNSTLAVVPLKPLTPTTSYYIVVTNSLKDTNGDSVGSSGIYTLLKSSDTTSIVDSAGASQIPTVSDEDAATLEQLRQLVSTSEFTADFALEDLAAGNIVVSWSFTTQSVGEVLTVARGLALADTPDTDMNPSEIDLGTGAGEGKSPFGAANIFEGTIDVPYYLTAPSEGDPTASLTKTWQAVNAVGGENNLSRLNPLPASTSIQTIPLLVTTPVDTETFPAPWKAVIYQHGITGDRTAMLALADSLAQAGFAVLAIDMPLHGVKATSPFYQEGNERTFDVDFITEDEFDNTTANVPDTVVDSSGKHYINLSNLVVNRDNVRQSVTDLFALTSAVSTIDVDKDGTADLNADEIYFVGHSLGAIVGTTFVALEPRIKDAVFAMGGGNIAKILDGSAGFSPVVVAGLQLASFDADAGVSLIDKTAVGEPRGAYESFLGVAQTVLDTTDPVNYTAAAVADRGVLFFEIVGDGSVGTSDLVIPNSVPDLNDLVLGTGPTVAAPLAGTEPMLALMGLTQVDSDLMGTNLQVSVKFDKGDHNSLISPDSPRLINPSAEVTAEIQKILATFLASDGAILDVTDTSVIESVED